MSLIKTWAAAICSASIALAVLEGLLPHKSTARSAKLAAALWFILAVISPLTALKDNAGDLSFDYKAVQPSDDIQSADELVLSQASTNLENELNELLSANGVEALDIEASVNISQDSGIYCDSVTVTLAENDAESSLLVSAIVNEAVGRQPEIRN